MVETNGLPLATSSVSFMPVIAVLLMVQERPELYIYKSQKKHEKTYRDGIPKKQPNKVGTHNTTVPLLNPILISFDIFPTRSYVLHGMTDC